MKTIEGLTEYLKESAGNQCINDLHAVALSQGEIEAFASSGWLAYLVDS
jgi:hypothetical protein